MNFGTGMAVGMSLSNSMHSTGGGGNLTMIEVILTVVLSIYVIQLCAIWLMAIIMTDDLFESEWNGSRRMLHFMWWHIPIIPIVTLTIKKVLNR
jgi:heme/copper-type cytochrome/quinol oxidase subunit 2